MISVNNLSIHFGGKFLFDNITFIINDKDKIGLVGKNGAGKSTLLKIICKYQQPHQGSVSIPSGLTLGYLPQEMKILSSKSVYDETITAFDEVLKIEDHINFLSDQLSSRTDYESTDYLKIIHDLNEANERLNFLGASTMSADTEKVLIGLGFEKDEFARKVSELSGGWQMRIELAKILLKKPNIVLLDEPTNHLDIDSIQWLEDFLINYNGAVILVSHDRTFLDNVTKRTIEISNSKIYDYKVPYSKYVEQRKERIEVLKSSFENQQKQIAETEKFIERFRYKATKARQVQSRIKSLEKLDLIELDEEDTSSIHFKFPPAPHSGKVVIEAVDLSKSYDEKLILSNINFAVYSKDKLAFVGRNGEGKSTLSKILVNKLDYTGNLIIGHNVSIGYYAQSQAEMLNPDKTVFETLNDIAVGEMQAKVRNILGSFLFSGEDVDKKVSILSGGEKSRLALAKLLLSPVNLLILDEPTNHLDMRSKDILKKALINYDGTLIIVSHDRDFLHGLTNKLYEFRNKSINEYLGDVTDFLKDKKLSNLKQLEINKNKQQNFSQSSNSSSKSLRDEKKIIDKERRKINNQIEQCEKNIETLEIKIKETENILTNPQSNEDIINSGEIYKIYEKYKKQLNDQMYEWEELHTKISDFEL